MQLLIDGYNLLHVTGVFANTVGPKSLERLHARFLDHLASLLGREQSERTTVVFDAKGRRAVGRRTMHHAGIAVLYAARHESADSYIVELLQAHHAPRQILVVSSDRAVQRAARRRRAKTVDSTTWYADLRRPRHGDSVVVAATPANGSDAGLSQQEAAWWLSQFGEELLREIEAEIDSNSGSDRPAPTAQECHPTVYPETTTSQRPPPDTTIVREDGDHPFPAEYLAQINAELERGALSKPRKSGRGRK